MLGEDFAVGVVDVDDGVDLAVVNITSRLRIQVLKPRLQSQQKPGKKKRSEVKYGPAIKGRVTLTA